MKIEFDEQTHLFSLTELTFEEFNNICSMIMFCTEKAQTKKNDTRNKGKA